MSDCDGLFSTTIQYMYCKLINPNCDIEIIVHSQDNPKAHGLNDSEVMEYLLSQDFALWVQISLMLSFKE